MRDDDGRNRIHADLLETDVTDLNLYVQNEQSDANASETSEAAEDNVSVASGPRTFTNHLLYLATKKGEPLLVEIAF